MCASPLRVEMLVNFWITDMQHFLLIDRATLTAWSIPSTTLEASSPYQNVHDAWRHIAGGRNRLYCYCGSIHGYEIVRFKANVHYDRIYTCVNRHRFLTSPNDALSELFLPKYANQHIKEHEGRQETYRYSNMSCTATKMQKEQSTMNLIPSHVPNSCEKKYLTPSVPMTNPTRLAAIIKRMFSTAPMAQTCRYQGCFPYWRLKVVNL